MLRIAVKIIPCLPDAIKTKTRPFHWLLAASAIGNLADGMSLAFLPIIASNIAATPLELSCVDGLRQLPLLFLALPAGIFLDRVNRRKAIIYCRSSIRLCWD